MPEADPLDPDPIARLTPGERDCLRLVLDHKPSKEIAIRLGIGPDAATSGSSRRCASWGSRPASPRRGCWPMRRGRTTDRTSTSGWYTKGRHWPRPPVFPREVVRRAIELGAAAFILVHNHPSGNSEPSAKDVEATLRLRSAAALFDISLHDHIIVARNGATSLRRKGLL